MANVQLIPDYEVWGQGNEGKPFICISDSTSTQSALNIAKINFDLTDLKLDISLLVDSYRGPQLPSFTLVLLKFSKNDEPLLSLDGEHLTILIDIFNKKVHGFTKMFFDENISHNIIPHKVALEKAIYFIQKISPDLIPINEVKLPKISNKKLTSKLSFVVKPKIGNTELHWINKHYEYLKIRDKKYQIFGMKVKLFIPDRNLWAWVIVDSAGNIQTFEKDIYWNFSKFIRDTQMWLHNDWIKINIPNFF